MTFFYVHDVYVHEKIFGQHTKGEVMPQKFGGEIQKSRNQMASGKMLVRKIVAYAI